MKAGIAKVNITPPVGVPMGGYLARKERSQGVHDDLYARALVLEDGDQRVALVSTDLLGCRKGLVREVRNLIERQTGIRGENVLLAATHTHSGPDTYLFMCDRTDLEPWISILPMNIAGAVYMAQRNIKNAAVDAATGRVEGISFNRQERERGGPVDPEVGAVRIDDSDGRPMAVVVNYACHAVVLGPTNLLISADYPGAVVGFLERAKDGVGAMFFNGACGNIDPIINLRAWGTGTFREVERMGTIIGAEALKVLEQTAGKFNVKIKVGIESFEPPLRKVPSLKEAQRVFEEKGQLLEKLREEKAEIEKVNRADYDLLQARFTRNLAKRIEEGEASTEVQVIVLDETVFLGIPGEMYTELGLDIKQRARELGFKNVIIAELANDLIGYIPTRKYLEQDVYPTKFSILAPGGEEKIRDTLINLMEKVSP